MIIIRGDLVLRFDVQIAGINLPRLHRSTTAVFRRRQWSECGFRLGGIQPRFMTVVAFNRDAEIARLKSRLQCHANRTLTFGAGDGSRFRHQHCHRNQTAGASQGGIRDAVIDFGTWPGGVYQKIVQHRVTPIRCFARSHSFLHTCRNGERSPETFLRNEGFCITKPR